MTLCSCPESLEVCGAGKGVFLTTVVYERLAMAILGSVPRLGIVHGKPGGDGWRDHTADLILERSRGEESRLGRGAFVIYAEELSSHRPALKESPQS